MEQNNNFFKKTIEKSDISREIINGEIKSKNSTSHFLFRQRDNFIDFLEENNLLKKDIDLENEIRGFGEDFVNNTYCVLNQEYKLELSKSVLWLIGNIYENINNKFILSFAGSNNKILLSRNVYNTLHKEHMDNNMSEYKWFVELYDKNIFYDKIYLKVEDGKLEFDINLKSINQKLPSIECGYPHNRIVFGAPGTGKSFELDGDKSIFEDRFERVTFHPDYSYAQFVGTYKPISRKDRLGNDIIQYKYVPGPFLRLLVEALNNPEDDFLLIIEEINRSNVAAVFGDVFQLLDRNEDGFSEYSINTSQDMRRFLKNSLNDGIDYKTIKIPNNLYIWATMNSADQGVYMMDTAFKRRWDFEYLGINHSEYKIQNKFIFINEDKVIDWNSLRKAINKFLSKKINEDKLLGPFFISPKYLPYKSKDDDINFDFFSEDSEGANRFIEIFKNKVIMYIFEDAAKGIHNQIFNENLVMDGKVLLSEVFSQFDKDGIEIFDDEIITFYKQFREDTEFTNFINAITDDEEYKKLLHELKHV